MDKIQAMSTFVAVVEAGSFVRAMSALGISKAAVSRHVAELEQHLETRLLQRTTRRLSLTTEGQRYFERCKEVLAAIHEAESEIRSRSGEAYGRLRVCVPYTFGNLHLAPLWGRFLAENPQVQLDVVLSDRMVDLVEEGYDMAVRVGILNDSALISRRLASTRLVMCASPFTVPPAHCRTSPTTRPSCTVTPTPPVPANGASTAPTAARPCASTPGSLPTTATPASRPPWTARALPCSRTSFWRGRHRLRRAGMGVRRGGRSAA